MSARFLHGLRGRAAPTPRADHVPARGRDNARPDITRMYWTARVTLLADAANLAGFDAVFASGSAGGRDAGRPTRLRRRRRRTGERRARADARREGSGPSASAELVRRAFDPRHGRADELRRALRRALPVIDSRRRGRPEARQLDLRRTLRRARAGRDQSFAPDAAAAHRGRSCC
jgi:hypothetical protein